MKNQKRNHNVPAKKQEVQPAIVTTQYFGPLPSPSTLEGYKAIDPQFPEVILSDFEKNGEHSRRQEQKALEAQIEDIKRGQYMGFFISISLLAIVFFSLWLGNLTFAGAAGLAYFATIAKSFITPKNK